MQYLGSSPAFYLLLAITAGCGSDGGSRPTRQYPDGMGGLASEFPTGAAGAGGDAPDGPNEGMDTGLGRDPNGAAGSGSLPIDPSSPAQSLREAAALSGRLIGTALAANRLNDVEYAAAAREFNYVTPENEMKWDALERQPGQFSFNNADRIVAFAESNGMQVKGHTLVWHSQLPDWVRQLTTRDQVLQAMEQHISSVVGQYSGRVQAWDVVNEAFTDGGNPRLRGSDPNDVNDPNNGNGNNGPDSIFRRLIGADYIDRAFILADAADPDALLFYNDFNTEGTSAKSNAVFEMVQGMLQRGVPIDGVGLQMHVDENVDGQRSEAQVAQNIARLTALGLHVQVSEFDVSLCGNAGLEQRRAQQRERLTGITQACLAQPLCSAITVWGVGDSDSWRDNECNGGRSEPLLFDANYQRKGAYFGVFDALVAAGAG